MTVRSNAGSCSIGSINGARYSLFHRGSTHYFSGYMLGNFSNKETNFLLLKIHIYNYASDFFSLFILSVQKADTFFMFLALKLLLQYLNFGLF